MKGGVGDLGTMWGCCLDMQRWNEDSQGADVIKLDERCEKQQEGIP